MKKRVLALVLVAVMLLNAFPGFAAETGTFVVDTVTAAPGETVTVNISVQNNPGIVSMKLAVAYDEDHLTFDGATVNPGLVGVFQAPQKKNPIILNWYQNQLDEEGWQINVEGDWTFVTLTFTVAEDATAGSHPITVTFDPNDVFDGYEDNVPFTVVNGGVVVEGSDVAVTGITLDKTSLSLTVGETSTLTAAVVPADATNQAVTFASSNPEVAEVNENGVVTALKAGTATITVTTVDGGFTASCEVTVGCAHDYAEATCTEPETCKLCGETKGEPLGHSFTNYVSDGNATCTEDGTKTAKCDRCDETDTIADEGSALGHDLGEWYVVTEASCEAEGEERRDCSRCDHFETRVIEPTGHTYTSAVVAPTCTEDGYTVYTCACGNSYTADIVPALGHDFGEWTVTVEAGCETDGEERRDCSRCDHFETRVIEATGHTYTTEIVEPTCTEDGYTVYTCACGDTYTDNVVPALGHDYATTWSKDENTHWHACQRCDAKADEAAHTDADHNDVCDVCDYALDHVHFLTLVPAVEPTCTETGYKAYYTCSGCETWFEDAFGNVVITDKAALVVPALGHEFGDWTVTVEAGCETDGEERRDCSRCDHFETRVIEATGHDYTSETVAPTCTEDGYTVYTCACGDTYTDNVVPALGHDFGEWTVTVEADCETDGEERRDCSRCDHFETRVIEATGHDYTSETVAPTCTEDGYTLHTCANCGDTYTDNVIPATGHSHAEAWSKGEEGHWHECACGDKADFAAHDYGTEGDNCVICGYERAHVHQLTLVSAVEATCTEAGNKAYYTCSGCENWFEDGLGTVVIADKSSVVIPAKGHDFAEATCTEPKTCKVCGETEGEALGHDMVEATCEEAAHCRREGCDYVEGEPLGHNFGEYVSNGDAKCGEDGTKTAECERCGETDTVVDEGTALEHEFEDATCTDPKTCKLCGETEGEALGHNDEDGDDICDVCHESVKPAPIVPDLPTDPVPPTGDTTNPILWTMLLLISAAGMLICVLLSRKKRAA